MAHRVLRLTGLLLLLWLATTITASNVGLTKSITTSARTGSNIYKADEKIVGTVSVTLSSSSPPPRSLRLSPNQGGVRHKVIHDFLSSTFLVIAILTIFLVVLCVINCNCSRICPCLCGDEAAIVRAELQAMDGRRVGKDEKGEEENIQGQVGGKDGVVDEVGIVIVAGEEKEEGEEGDKKEGGGRGKEDDEESEAPLPPSTPPLKSLTSSLLALLGMNATISPTSGILGGGWEGMPKKVEQEMAQLQEEAKEEAGREGGVEDLKKKFDLRMQWLQGREGVVKGGLAEESKDCQAAE